MALKSLHRVGVDQVAFIVEIILKIVACNDDPLEFFWGIDLNKPHGPAGKNQTKGLQAWNIFDFTVVIACLMPESVIPCDSSSLVS